MLFCFSYKAYSQTRSHLEYGEFIVQYKYIKINDTIYCPYECLIINKLSNKTYYFYPDRFQNSIIISKDTTLVDEFGSPQLYKQGDNKFQILTNSINCFINTDTIHINNSIYSKVNTNLLYSSKTSHDSIIYICYSMTGLINIYNNSFQINRINSLISDLKLGDSNKFNSVDLCIIYNLNTSKEYAVFNFSDKFNILTDTELIKLDLIKSSKNYFYTKSMAF